MRVQMRFAWFDGQTREEKKIEALGKVAKKLKPRMKSFERCKLDKPDDEKRARDE